MTDTKPDLIVGIDFGMTCMVVVCSGLRNLLTCSNEGTGVAYAIPSAGTNTVRYIQKWPGRMQSNEDKVKKSDCNGRKAKKLIVC